MTDEELLALPDDEYEAVWDGIFADISTVYSLRPGHVLTQEDFDAIQRFDKHYRDQEESGTSIFHRAYQQGLREGGSADILELKKKIDRQFVEHATEKAMRSFAERRCDEYRQALTRLVHDIDDLIANSGGVYGLHLNGDEASWESLTEGGQFEPWLISLETAREALPAAPHDHAPVDAQSPTASVIEASARGNGGSAQ